MREGIKCHTGAVVFFRLGIGGEQVLHGRVAQPPAIFLPRRRAAGEERDICLAYIVEKAVAYSGVPLCTANQSV